MPKQRGAAKRALRVAAMAAGAGGSYLGYLAQSLFLDDERRVEKRKRAHRLAARRVSDEMGQLKGPLMKLGQALSLHTDVLPAEMLEELSRLQMRAPGMHPSLVRAQFRAALGQDPEDLFAQFDAEPFAAASLGQVHRARSRAGELLAVKIQYPGIREAIEGDFTWFRAAALPARLSKHLPGHIIDELYEQLLAETDYRREAENLRRFAHALRPLEFVDVPRVYPQLSGDKVLTMSLMNGQHLEDFLATRPPQRLRDLVGGRLFELFYFQVLKMEAVHGDPHWGNYLFRPDGTIGLIDFGCVKYLPAAFVENLRKVFLYPGRRDSEEFFHLMEERYKQKGTKLSKAGKAALSRFSINFYGKVYPPDESQDALPFDFGNRSFLASYMSEIANLTQSKVALPEYVILARAELGLYQTLHRLRARVTTSRIVRRYLERGQRTRLRDSR